jgi:general secretion pathway protein G
MGAAIVTGKQPARQFGFSLLELLLVMVLISLLAALVMPVATNSVIRAKEATLKENLYVMRKALDDYYADHGKYPDNLTKLSEQRYIRQIPVDPLTERSDTWAEIRSQQGTGDSGIIDVHSGSDLKSADEGFYRDW